MAIEWTGAAVEPTAGDEPPSPDAWESVTVPGRPPSLAGADAAAYRGRFPDPRESADERGLLTVRGVFATATVWINGQRAAAGDLAAPIRIPFEPMGDNEVIVECRAPTDRFGGVEDTDAVPATARVPSIREGVEVEAVPAVYIHDLAVRGDLAEDPSIEVAATVDAAAAVEDRLTLSLRPEGFRGAGAMERAQVRAEAGQRVRIERSLSVRDERRWWPRELGGQYRYTVRAKLGDHERAATTGLVTVDRDGGDLLVNGQRHRPRGVVVPPTADPETAVDRALDANATLVRARAHVPPESLLRACDEAGLLVWHDLPLTGPAPVDLDRGRELARSLARSRRHHPSIACWGAVDDPVDPFGTDLGAGRSDRLRFRWRAWRAGYDRADAEALAGSLPSDRVTFPVSGAPGIDADAVHLYPGWRYLDATDVDWLVERYPHLAEVVGATGAGSLTPTEEGAQRDGTDRAEGVPGLDPDALSAAATSDPERSQREQARILSTVLDGLRRHGAGTVVVDSLSDVAEAGGTGLVTADGERKPAFRAVATAFQPVQAVLDAPPTGGTVGVTVCNDTPTDREGELAWTAGDATGSADVAVDGFGRADAGGVRVPASAERLTLELRLGDGTVTNTYDLTLWD